jgi:hypothetical protein
MIEWYIKVAGSLERIVVVLNQENPGLLPQMLALAGPLAPRLHTLILKGNFGVGLAWGEQCFVLGGPLVQSLAFLGQLRRLELSDWAYSSASFAPEIEIFSCLQMLEVISPLFP